MHKRKIRFPIFVLVFIVTAVCFLILKPKKPPLIEETYFARLSVACGHFDLKKYTSQDPQIQNIINKYGLQFTEPTDNSAYIGKVLYVSKPENWNKEFRFTKDKELRLLMKNINEAQNTPFEIHLITCANKEEWSSSKQIGLVRQLDSDIYVYMDWE